MKAKKICIACLAVLMMLPGCSQGSNHAESDTGNLADAEVSGEKIVIQDSEDTVEKNTVFTDPFADGTLTYELKECNIYDNLNDAGITTSDLIDPHNTFYSQEIGEQFQSVEDYVGSDGTINENFNLVILDITITNEDAVGMVKKNEFSVANIALRGGQNVSQYNVSYFSEASSADPEQPLYYELEQGNSITVKIGYFILKDDMENMIGVISDSDVQFLIQ
jgi:hypothetical protein